MDASSIDAYLTTIRHANDAAVRPCRLVTDAFIPLPAHKVGVAHLFLRPRFILADPMGCGKTPQTIVGYGYLKEKDPSLRLLVLTSKSAQFQWKESVERFLQGVSVRVLGYTDTQGSLSPAARRATYSEPCDVWVTTYALLAREEEHLLPILDNYVVVFDEVHHINNWKQTTLYPVAARASQKAKGCWGLSATPMTKDKLDQVFSLVELVRPGTLPPYPEFRRTYFVLRLVKPKWKIKGTNKPAKPFYEVRGYQNLDHLSAVLDRFYLRRSENVIKPGLPPITFVTDSVFLEKPQRDIYDSIVAKHWPGAKTKIAQLAALTYAQQALDAPEILGFTKVGNAKLDRLVERLQGEQAGQKVLVYSKFVEVLRVIEARLTSEKISHARVIGEDSVRARGVACARFMTDPTVNVMLLTDAGGEALDLQAAQCVLFYDLPWSHGSFLQVIGRARRIGSLHSNILCLLLGGTPNTIDTHIAHQLSIEQHLIAQLIRQGTHLNLEQLRTESHSLVDSLFS